MAKRMWKIPRVEVDEGEKYKVGMWKMVYQKYLFNGNDGKDLFYYFVFSLFEFD